MTENPAVSDTIETEEVVDAVKSVEPEPTPYPEPGPEPEPVKKFRAEKQKREYKRKEVKVITTHVPPESEPEPAPAPAPVTVIEAESIADRVAEILLQKMGGDRDVSPPQSKPRAAPKKKEVQTPIPPPPRTKSFGWC
jgi:hypothetical protein